MKMKVASLGGTSKVAPECSSPSRSFREKVTGKLRLFAVVDRNNRWPVQGWSSGEESHYELDEQVVAEEAARPFTMDKQARWPVQGWCKAHKKPDHQHRSPGLELAVSTTSRPSVRSRWPQGW